MQLKRLTHHILQHTWSSAACAFFISLIPFVDALGGVIGVLVTLVRGANAGAVTMAAVVLAYLLKMNLLQILLPSNNLYISLGFTIVVSCVAWVLALLLRQRMSFNQLLQYGGLACILLISIIHLVNPEIEAWWANILTHGSSVLKDAAIVTAKSSQASSSLALQDVSKKMLQIIPSFATGLMLAAIFSLAFFQLMLGRLWQGLFFNAKSMISEMQRVRLSPHAGFLLAAFALLAYFNNRVAIDTLVVLLAVFLIAGLSLIHYYINIIPERGSRWFVFGFIYLFILWITPYVPLAIILFALFDVWFDFRKKLFSN